jgi:hypothetical protein
VVSFNEFFFYITEGRFLNNKILLGIDKQQSYHSSSFYKVTSSFSASFDGFQSQYNAYICTSLFKPPVCNSICTVTERGEAMSACINGIFFVHGPGGKKCLMLWNKKALKAIAL